MYNILICDDEPDIVAALRIYLSDESYRFFEASDGKQALAVVKSEDIHLILLDIMMPGMDGITALAKIRETSNIPILLLSAKGEDADKVLGLSVGADDYITKPFSPIEVKARVSAALRRYMRFGGGQKPSGTLVCGGIELDDTTKTVTADGLPVSLTPREYDILKLLMENPGRVFSPKEIYRAVWQQTPVGNDNTVAVHIRHLREKLEINPAEPRHVKAVWGHGYKIEGDAT